MIGFILVKVKRNLIKGKDISEDIYLFTDTEGNLSSV